jgi:uncharacterized HAD superfamily protein
MKIGVDLDEVLADYLSAVIDFHNASFGSSLKKEDFVSYKFWEIWGGTVDEAIDKIYEFNKTDFFKKIKPVPGSQEVLDVLKQNHELFVITSRQQDFANETKAWLDEHFPGVFQGVHFTNKYSKSGESRSKLSVCDELEIDVLIEDSLDYALECLNEKRKVFLLDYSWNQSTDLPEKISRVDSWPEILNNFSDKF